MSVFLYLRQLYLPTQNALGNILDIGSTTTNKAAIVKPMDIWNAYLFFWLSHCFFIQINHDFWAILFNSGYVLFFFCSSSILGDWRQYSDLGLMTSSTMVMRSCPGTLICGWIVASSGIFSFVYVNWNAFWVEPMLTY